MAGGENMLENYTPTQAAGRELNMCSGLACKTMRSDDVGPLFHASAELRPNSPKWPNSGKYLPTQVSSGSTSGHICE